MKLKVFAAAALLASSFAVHANDIPQACQDYFDAVEAFAAKYPQVADAYKQSIQQTKDQLAAVPGDKSAMAPGCQAALDAFKQSTAGM